MLIGNSGHDWQLNKRSTMISYYFNISLNGVHVFRTDLTTDTKLYISQKDILTIKFPNSEGWQVTEMQEKITIQSFSLRS